MCKSSDHIRRAAALGIVLVATAVFAAACTREKPSPAPRQSAPDAPAASVPQGEGGLSLLISPQAPDRKTILSLSPQGFAIQDSRVTWYVDGAPSSSSAIDRFDCAGLTRGRRVRATAVLNGRDIRSPEVTIGNTPPELTSVSLRPSRTGLEEMLEVSAAAVDVDGDPVTIAYEWTVNDVLAGNGPKLARTFRRGDQVCVRVIAHDGRSSSTPVVLNHTIANHAPVFVEHQDYSYAGNTFVYQVRASDADGDGISYSLEAPPSGMIIDQNTGRVTWTVPGDFRGNQPINIIADDGHGGSARYTVTFTIRE